MRPRWRGLLACVLVPAGSTIWVCFAFAASAAPPTPTPSGSATVTASPSHAADPPATVTVGELTTTCSVPPAATTILGQTFTNTDTVSHVVGLGAVGSDSPVPAPGVTRTLAANASTTLTLTLPDSQFGFPSTAQSFLDGAPLGTSALFVPCAAPKHAEQTVRSGINTTLEPDCPFHGIFTLTTPAEHGTVHLVPSIGTEGFVVQYQSRQGYVGPDQLVVFCHDATPGVAPFYATISLTVVAAPTTTASNTLPSSSSPSNSSPSRPAPASPAAQTQGVTLAATGAGTGPTIALGVGLVIAGLTLTWAARQRHRRAH